MVKLRSQSDTAYLLPQIPTLYGFWDRTQTRFSNYPMDHLASMSENNTQKYPKGKEREREHNKDLGNCSYNLLPQNKCTDKICGVIKLDRKPI